MGEAKNRLDALGPTRRLRVERADLMNLITHFVQPDDRGKLQVVGDRMKRRAVNSAMDQLGVLAVWRKARKGAGSLTPEVIESIPLVAIRPLSVDAIQTIQGMLAGPLDIRDSLNLADFEDMLDDALAGLFDPGEDPAPPADETTAPPVDEFKAAAEAPQALVDELPVAG